MPTSKMTDKTSLAQIAVGNPLTAKTAMARTLPNLTFLTPRFFWGSIFSRYMMERNSAFLSAIKNSNAFSTQYRIGESIFSPYIEQNNALLSVIKSNNAFSKQYRIGEMFSEPNFLSLSKRINESILRYDLAEDSVIKTIKSFSVSDLTEEHIYQFDDVDFSTLTLQEKQEVDTAITEVFSEPLNSQQKFKEWCLKFERENPVIAALFVYLVKNFWAIIAFLYFGTATTTKETAVRENPKQTSQIIDYVNVNQEVFIIDTAPYYHKIKFINSETGKTKTGWIPKRSIRLADSDESSKENSAKTTQSD